ncbi:hypothetical protein [Aureimonas sp. AU12]|uniref:hypothetical protein n=1 Tax=Aureimonas sp. AU12 TaxID=1638161 RepID=UPI0007837D23|nr:hypothetical protein [Aureimonas sp. AU12]
MSDHAPIDPMKLQRQKRLEETLKENLRRRKAQARARSQPVADDGARAIGAEEPASSDED